MLATHFRPYAGVDVAEALGGAADTEAVPDTLVVSERELLLLDNSVALSVEVTVTVVVTLLLVVTVTVFVAVPVAESVTVAVTVVVSDGVKVVEELTVKL